MQDFTLEEGVTTVCARGGCALFASARAAPRGEDAAQLSERARASVERRFARRVTALWARQEHTALSYTYTRAAALAGDVACVGACDALITPEPDVALVVRTADCLPVALLADDVVAIVHAGWRGLAADVIGATVRRLAAEFGVGAGALAAVVGVGIGPCHYSVGPEVIDALAPIEVFDGRWRLDGRVDLAAFARARLIALGVARDKVSQLPGCTSCLSQFHSYRRDGKRAGRQWSAVVRS